jgi:hypothetical protein
MLSFSYRFAVRKTIPPSKWTNICKIALNYGVIAEDGTVDVRITYDHRVLDGSSVARALVEVEQILKGPVAASLLPASHNGCQIAANEARTATPRQAV